jgi:hypothetical protein
VACYPLKVSTPSISDIANSVRPEPTRILLRHMSSKSFYSLHSKRHATCRHTLPSLPQLSLQCLLKVMGGPNCSDFPLLSHGVHY